MPRVIIQAGTEGVKAKGRLRVFWSPHHQKWIARKWPSGNGGDTPRRAKSRADFTNAVRLVKKQTGEEVAMAYEVTRGIQFVPRDLLMKAVYGTLLEITDTSGKTWMGVRVAQQEIETLLNSISSIPGSMLLRDADEWVALLPGTAGQVLSIDAGTLMPYWSSSGGGGGSAIPGLITSGQLGYEQSFSADYISVVPIVATADANISSIGLVMNNANATAQWVVGLYDDVGGRAHNLLSQSATQTGWDAGAIAQAPLAAAQSLVAGNVYWLAFWSDSAHHPYGPQNTVRYHYSWSSTSLPNPIPSGHYSTAGLGLFAIA